MSRGALASLLAVAITAATLAGCLGTERDLTSGDGDAPDGQRGPIITQTLFGWVLDPAFQPIPGANVTVVGAAAATATNDTGFYGFESVPRQEEIILIAEHTTFATQSKKVLLPLEGNMRVNFTLEPKPIKTGHVEVLDFQGLIACQLVADAHEGHAASTRASAEEEEPLAKADCGFLDANNQDRWEFSVGPDVAGIVIETSWEAETSLAEAFTMTVETTGYGAEDAILAEVAGPSVLKGIVTRHQADRFYAEGGIVRVTVAVDPNMEDEETGIGAAFAYQQSFAIHASVFYVDPAPPAYSFHT